MSDEIGEASVEFEDAGRHRPEPIVIDVHVHHHFDGPIELAGTLKVEVVMVQIPNRIGVRPGIPTTQSRYL